MIILLDLDGVIADFTQTLLEQYNFLTNEQVTIADIKSNKTFKWVKDPTTMKKLMEVPGFIRGLPPIVGAIDGVKTLHQRGHDIVFVSNGTNCPTSGHEKREWLKFYFNKLWQKAPLVLTNEKFRVRGDVLIDDDIKNFERLHPDTKALLFHQPYNASIVGPERVSDWGDLIRWVTQHE